MKEDREKINERFNHLKQKMIDPKFQHNEGLSNEVGYYIFDYPANRELFIRKSIQKIEKSELATEVNLKVYDVYDIMIKILKDQQIYTGSDPIPILEKIEEKHGFDSLIEQINNILEMSENNNLIVQYINKKIKFQKQCIIFLVGLGKVYPNLNGDNIIDLDSKFANKVQQALNALNYHVKSVMTWTTDGFFRETKGKLARAQSLGCQLVEMECSALAACSKFRNVKFGQILFTADSLANTSNYDKRGWGKSFRRASLDVGIKVLEKIDEFKN